MTGKEMLEIVCPRALARRKFCNVGKEKARLLRSRDSSGLADRKLAELQSTNSDQLRARLQLLLAMTGRVGFAASRAWTELRAGVDITFRASL